MLDQAEENRICDECGEEFWLDMPLCPECKGDTLTVSTEFDEKKSRTCDECGKNF